MWCFVRDGEILVMRTSDTLPPSTHKYLYCPHTGDSAIKYIVALSMNGQEQKANFCQDFSHQKLSTESKMTERMATNSEGDRVVGV